MKTHLSRPRAGIVSRRHAAFTLIELLAVMAIILILAGLILNIAGSAQYNSAKSRAQSEIAAMSTALESYKSDNGAYPSDTTATEGLDAKVTTTPTSYLNASQFLYQSLAGFPTTSSSSTNSGGTPTPSASSTSKAYMVFRPDQIRAVSSTDPVSIHSAKMYLADPFGFSYGYSTIYAVNLAKNQAKPTPDLTPVMTGYNPTFDLWSTAGYATGGKTVPSPPPTGAPQSLWVKNW